MGACAAGGACCCAIFTVSFPLASHLTENCGRQRLSQSRGVLVLVSWLGSEYGRLRLRGLRQQVIRAVLRHAREDLGRAHRLDCGLDRRRGELDPSFDPSFCDLPRQPLASEASLMRRPSVDALAPALANDAVAVLADVTVIRGRPSAHWICSRDAKSKNRRFY